MDFPGKIEIPIELTTKLLRKAQPDTVQTTIFYPLKCTKLYEKVVSEGLFDTHTPMPHNYYSGSYLNFPENKKKEILKWQYILTNYNSRIVGLFILSLHTQLTFRILVLLRKVYITFREKGFLFMLKAIMQKIKI